MYYSVNSTIECDIIHHITVQYDNTQYIKYDAIHHSTI